MKLNKKQLDDEMNKFLKSIGIIKPRAYMRHAFKNYLKFIIDGGFPYNTEEANPGAQTSNTGDAGEAMFSARALLVGLEVYKCESRISKADSIVRRIKENTLKTIQIKAVDPDFNHFKLTGRPRGGKGTGVLQEGKKLSSYDSEILALVCKRTAMCTIIPLKWCEDRNLTEITREQAEQFKERWDLL